MHRQADKTCFLCILLHDDYRQVQTTEHHVIFGRANKKLSEKYGLKVYLCQRHHVYEGGKEAVHRNHENDLMLKRIAQRTFQDVYPDKDFREIFGKNYLEEPVAAGTQKAPAAAGFRILEDEE